MVDSLDPTPRRSSNSIQSVETDPEMHRHIVRHDMRHSTPTHAYLFT